MADFDFFSNSSMAIRKAIGFAFMLSLGLNVLMAGFLMLDARYSRRDLRMFKFLAGRHTAKQLVEFMGRPPSRIYGPGEQLPVRTEGRRVEPVFPVEHKVYLYAMPSSARFLVYVGKDGAIDRFLCYYD